MAEKKKCGAALRKKPGQFCQIERGLMANGRCRIHGGKQPRGVASPHFVTGERSRYMLPLRMRADYETALSDPKLLELKHDIAAVQSRAQDLIKRVDTGESGHLWKQLQKAYADLQVAVTKAEQLEALATLGSLIQRGSADYHAWEEFGKQVDRKQRLVESERKRAIELHQTITLDQLQPYLIETVAFIRRNITDREQLSEFQRIIETRFGVSRQGVIEATVVDGDGSAAEPFSA